MKGHRFVLAALLISSASAYAQPSQRIRPEVRPFSAAYLPAGGMRDEFKSATTLGAQAALEICTATASRDACTPGEGSLGLF